MFTKARVLVFEAINPNKGVVVATHTRKGVVSVMYDREPMVAAVSPGKPTLMTPLAGMTSNRKNGVWPARIAENVETVFVVMTVEVARISPRCRTVAVGIFQPGETGLVTPLRSDIPTWPNATATAANNKKINQNLFMK